MTYPRVPTFAKTADWPRKAAEAINSMIGRVDTIETFTAQFSALGNYADDTAAAAGGVAVGKLYRTGSAIKIRVA